MKKKLGRPRINKKTVRVTTTVSIDPKLQEWIDKTLGKGNRSKYINALIEADRETFAGFGFARSLGWQFAAARENR